MEGIEPRLAGRVQKIFRTSVDGRGDDDGNVRNDWGGGEMWRCKSKWAIRDIITVAQVMELLADHKLIRPTSV
jgi:hypothetical protein